MQAALLDIIAIATAPSSAAPTIELFGKSKLEWFQTFLELPHGIPSHDTFGDVKQFQQCFMAWTQAVSDLGKWWHGNTAFPRPQCGQAGHLVIRPTR